MSTFILISSNLTCDSKMKNPTHTIVCHRYIKADWYYSVRH